MNARLLLRPVSFVATASLATACSSAPTSTDAPVQTVVANVAQPAKATSGVDSSLASVTAVRVPRALTIDGDLSEWGSFDPPAPLPVPKALKPEDERTHCDVADPDPDPHGPNPKDAPAHVAVAIGADRVLVAAKIAPESKSALWVGVGVRAAEIRPIGEYTRGMGFEPLVCHETRYDFTDGEYYDTHEPNPPEVIAACKATVDRYKAFVDAGAREFAKTLRIDPTSVKAVGASGALEPIPGATVKSKTGAEGTTIEVSLPIASLPRLSEAPLKKLRLFARVADNDAPPKLAREDWFAVALPEAVSFEPFGLLREKVLFEEPCDPQSYPAYNPPRGLSYRVDEPDRIRSTKWGDGLESVDYEIAPIYRKLLDHGDVEIGEANAGLRYVAVRFKGTFVEAIPISAPIQANAVRGDDLVVAMFSEASYNPMIGSFTPPSWSVLVVAKDGTHRELTADLPDDMVCPLYLDTKSTMSKDLDTLGWTARCESDGDVKTVEATMKWNAKEKKYDLSTKVGAAAKAKTKGKAKAEPAAKAAPKKNKKKKK